MDVSVVVCTRNRASRLAGCLDILSRALDRAADDRITTELVVVDNASDDDTVAVLSAARDRDRRIRPISAPVPGLGRARNAGIWATRGDLLLFTDDDVAVPENWVTALSEPLRAGRADAVAGGVRMADHLWRAWMTEELAAKYYAHVPVPPQVNPGLVGACMGATQETVLAVGFDNQLGTAAYPGGEDSLFYARLLGRGARIAGVTGAVVEHRFDESRLEPAHLARQARGHGRCDAYFYHHWLGARLPLPRTRALAHRARALAQSARSGADPYDEKAVAARRAASLHAELVALRHTPRRYGPREGAPAS